MANSMYSSLLKARRASSGGPPGQADLQRVLGQSGIHRETMGGRGGMDPETPP